jgi:hypothetical protein
MNMPSLEKLKLLPTMLPTHRAESIDYRNRNGYIPTNTDLWAADYWRRKHLQIRVIEVLLGTRAPAATAINWPSIVYEVPSIFRDDRPRALVKLCDPNEGGFCHYEYSDMWLT